MSNKPEIEEDQEEQKSKKPAGIFHILILLPFIPCFSLFFRYCI